MGSQTATKRSERTNQVMQNIMTGGEISKKREKQLQDAANRGRGVDFVTTSGSVGNLTQRDGSPVTKTGSSAVDYTGSIVASRPTVGEIIGDTGRAIFGGKADDTKIRKDTGLSKNILPEPKSTKGIVPTLIEKGGTIGMIASSILSGKQKNKKKEPPTISQIYDQGVQNFADLQRIKLGGANPKLGD